jgi:hypothetical protein
MGQVDHDQANLLLKLYELRRDPRLREARAWFIAEFHAQSLEEFLAKYPAGSQTNASIRMVTSYWAMACGLVNRGLIDDELFFENSAEFWFVWERMKKLVPALRASSHNPSAYKHLELAAERLEKHWDRMSPGLADFQKQRVAQSLEAASKAAQKKS